MVVTRSGDSGDRSGDRSGAIGGTSHRFPSEPPIALRHNLETRPDEYEVEPSDQFKLARVVVWKKICFERDINENERNEFKKLMRLRHVNVIHIGGFYFENLELGLLLYPAATSDLATILEAQDHASKSGSKNMSADAIRSAKNSLKELLESLDSRDSEDSDSYKTFCLRSLKRISSATEYLHSNRVRLQNLTPGNILLGSDHQLWITGFGPVAGTSDITQNESEPGLREASRYSAPKVSQDPLKDNVFSDDVFSLGCIILEMLLLYNEMTFTAQQKQFRMLPDRRYCANIDNIIGWLEDAKRKLDQDCLFLLTEVRQMLSKRPESRPFATHICRTINILLPEKSDRLDGSRILSLPSNSLSTTLTYGNTYEARPRPEEDPCKGVNENPWCFYVYYDDKVLEIEKMHFFLHPSWPDPQRVLVEHPFEVHSTCWAEIAIKVAVFLKSPTCWKYEDDDMYRPWSEPIILEKKLEIGSGGEEGKNDEKKQFQIWRKLS